MAMNTRTAAAIVLTVCSVAAHRPAYAQSPDDCMKVKGRLMLESRNGRTLGTLTNGGILTGTTEIVFGPAASPTPDPTTVSFVGDLTLTTNRGVLKTHDVYLFDGSIGVGTGIHRIDPNASTGVFAGSTGVLYDNSKATGPGTIQGAVTGTICFENW
jgi:hypothetical protein